jgi:hypothetical protein
MNGFSTRHPENRRGWLGVPTVLVLLVGCAAVIAVVIWIHQARSAAARATAKPILTWQPGAVPRIAHEKSADRVLASSPEELWGIQFRSIELVRNNTAVDLRYTVVGPDKAAVLGEGGSTAYLVDLASGKMLPLGSGSSPPTSLPPHSRARSMALMMRESGDFPPTPSRLVAGKTYSILLPNVGGLLKRGSRVVVTVGNLDCSTDIFTLK